MDPSTLLSTILVFSVVIPMVVGLLGSSIEYIGKKLNSPKVEHFGDAIEALAGDLPKFFEKLTAIKNSLPPKK